MSKAIALAVSIVMLTGCMVPVHKVPVHVYTEPNAKIYANNQLIGSPSDDKPAEAVPGVPEVDIHFGADYRTWVNDDAGVGHLYTRLDGADDARFVATCGDQESMAVTVDAAPQWPAALDVTSKVLAWVPIVGMLMPVAWDVPYTDVHLPVGECDE